MVRGLYLHHTGSLLPQNVVFRWRPNEVFFGRGREYFEASAPGLAYGDVFVCRYLFARETGLEASVWWLRFYRATVFRCFVAPRDPVTQEESDANSAVVERTKWQATQQS